MKKILLVDDEQNVLNALRRELKSYYEIETFDNPLKALARCRETQFDLVVADYKMPDINGLEFLKDFGQLQPDAPRLLLSGEVDINSLIRIINETHIYRFLAKPWDQNELLSSIGQALAYHDAILKSRAQAAVSRDSHSAEQTHQDDAPFRIVLVESDEHLLTLISSELSDESGHDALCDVIQQEINQGIPTRKFKCIVESFTTAQAALAHIEKNHCDLVIASQNLSDMEGIQLLSNVRQKLPDVASILINNYPDKSTVLLAINEAQVQSLLQLQWVNYELRTDALRQAWNLHRLKTAAIQALAARELLLGKTRRASSH